MKTTDKEKDYAILSFLHHALSHEDKSSLSILRDYDTDDLRSGWSKETVKAYGELLESFGYFMKQAESDGDGG